jgi:hypothetical protein
MGIIQLFLTFLVDGLRAALAAALLIGWPILPSSSAQNEVGPAGTRTPGTASHWTARYEVRIENGVTTRLEFEEDNQKLEAVRKE